MLAARNVSCRTTHCAYHLIQGAFEQCTCIHRHYSRVTSRQETHPSYVLLLVIFLAMTSIPARCNDELVQVGIPYRLGGQGRVLFT